ncbi:MAG: response regulator [Thiohalomonadales bacterium]
MNVKGSRILLVDDTPANIDVLRETLENVGYNIAAASSGEKALNIVKRIKVDLILLDVMMPGLSGFDTCKALKNNVTTEHIPIIFITAKAAPEDISNAFQLGAVDYVVKPFNNSEILARVRTHLSLQKSHDSLVALNNQKDSFLGMAAHDLRSPLSGVLGYLELLLEEDDSISVSERRKFVSTAIKACSNMRMLIGDLLDTAAISRGAISINSCDFDLVELVRERCDICRFSANKKSMSISLLGSSVLTSFADRARMGQVIDNLLTNAIKYSPAGSSITIEILTKNDTDIVKVMDQGPGLSVSDIENLFSDFKTLSAKPTGNEFSTGLGLSISKRVMDAHNGKVTASNLHPTGACFSIELPSKVFSKRVVG